MICSQCGKPFTDTACGPTHAVLAQRLIIDERIAMEVMGLPRPAIPQEYIDYPPIWESVHLEGWLLISSGYESGDRAMVIPKPYTVEMSYAFEVMERCGIWLCPADDGHSWAAGRLRDLEPSPERGVWAETAPMAICLAALGGTYDKF